MEDSKNELAMFPYVDYTASDSKLEKRQQPYFPPATSWEYYRKYGQEVVS